MSTNRWVWPCEETTAMRARTGNARELELVFSNCLAKFGVSRAICKALTHCYTPYCTLRRQAESQSPNLPCRVQASGPITLHSQVCCCRILWASLNLALARDKAFGLPNFQVNSDDDIQKLLYDDLQLKDCKDAPNWNDVFPPKPCFGRYETNELCG